MTRVWRIIAIFGLGSQTIRAAQAKVNSAEYFSTIPCGVQALAYLKDLNVSTTGEVSGISPGGLPEGVIFPTNQVGTWAHVVGDSASREISVERITESGIDKSTFSKPDCSLRSNHTTPSSPSSRSVGFDDEMLKKLISTGSAGAIYSWSPRMPYSVRGIETIRAAAKRLGLRLTIVLDPLAPQEEARAALQRFHVNDIDPCLAPLTSLELRFRHLIQHFPSVITYGASKMDDFLFPGLSTEQGYVQFFERRSKESNR